MLKGYPEVLTIKELREILYIGRNKAYEMLDRGEIRGFKLGRAWRVCKDDVLRFLRESGG
jgi:excisionase family DNA binding protein